MPEEQEDGKSWRELVWVGNTSRLETYIHAQTGTFFLCRVELTLRENIG